MHNRVQVCVAGLVLLMTGSLCDAQQIYRVVEAAPGGGDGLAWGSAFDDLQSALAVVVSGDEIWVGQGKYTPIDASSSFVLVDGVGIYGGFGGTETVRSQRDPALHLSVLSGDVGRDDTFNPYLLNTPNAGHVVYALNVSAGVVLDGLTIEHGAYGPTGTVSNDPLMGGSGIYAVGSSLTINDCTIRMNYCAWVPGGGIYSRDGSLTITNSILSANYGHLTNGGAIMISGTGGGLIEDCEFVGNQLVFSSPDSSGGAIYHNSTGSMTVRRCVFDSNTVRPFFSIGDDLGYGGAISSFSAPLLVENSVFRNNTATIGGAIVAWNEAKIVNCVFDTNHAVAREGSFTEYGGFGGGVTGYTFTPRDMFIENCTFVNNTGKEHGGASGGWNANLVISNSIFWNNSGWNPEFQGYYREQIGGNFDLSHSLLPGIFGPPSFGEDSIDVENLPGCIELDPLFVGSGDYRLLAGSPAIDAGDNAGWTTGLMTDLDGNPRFVDDPGTVDTGAGGSPMIDMGVYEFQVVVACPADLTGDGLLNFFDVSVFLQAFAVQDVLADFNGDGVYNFFDVSAFLQSFAAGCP